LGGVGGGGGWRRGAGAAGRGVVVAAVAAVAVAGAAAAAATAGAATAAEGAAAEGTARGAATGSFLFPESVALDSKGRGMACVFAFAGAGERGVFFVWSKKKREGEEFLFSSNHFFHLSELSLSRRGN
jgi:hypothetical protein